MTVLTYADDIKRMRYFKASGANLNYDKTEGVWIGRSATQPTFHIHSIILIYSIRRKNEL